MQQNISSLELTTQTYWNLSQAYNGRTDTPVTTERAFKSINRCLDMLNPYRPLAFRFRGIRDEIIEGGNGRKRSIHTPNNVTQLDSAKVN